MKIFRCLSSVFLYVWLGSCFELSSPSRVTIRQFDEQLQDIVTWDQYSVKVHGERVLIMSGELHPWRLPVPSLIEDVLEKIKALGFNTVSFYVHWGLVEYAKDDFNFEGWLNLEPLFEAAKKTGMYLIARPGPYINAETTGGGTPGWGVRVKGAWRTYNQTYIDAMEGYVRTVSRILAKAQITNGGPLILVQPENEYSYCLNIPNCPVPWPQPQYMDVLQQFMREEGLIVPTITNEVQYTSSNYAPGSGPGEVDIRGYDNYPLSFICNDTSNWPDGKLPTNFWEVDRNLSATNPNAIMELQAGAHGRWGWFSPEDCGVFTGSDFERVFYKNYVAFSTTIMNLYMMFGGTNWGGIASPATITSYDYGGAIRESRLLTREKYSELKLLAQFLKVSPAYLTTAPLNEYPVNTVNGSSFVDNNAALAVTQLADVVGNSTVFWIVRHSAYNSLENTTYGLTIPTSRGTISIPTLGGALQLNGRDSKIHVSDYSIGTSQILYSSGELLTWKKFSTKTIVVIHGFTNEIHETAFIVPPHTTIKVVAGNALLNSTVSGDIATLNYQITTAQTVIAVGDIQVVIVDRNTAFNFWVPDWDNRAAVVKFPYLIRSAEVKAGTLGLRGDLNVTQADGEVFVDSDVKAISYNGRVVKTTKTAYGSLTFNWKANLKISLPNLKSLDWKYLDGLPEVQPGYNDAGWPNADLRNSTNPRKPTTPTSLYSSDYGFHTNNILWRGHFTATGAEQNFTAEIQGGSAFSTSVWLDNTQISYFTGIYNVAAKNLTSPVPKLRAGSKHIITVIQDHMGLEQNYGPGGDLHKIPRGILNYNFGGSNTSVTWKVTGDLGAEYPVDRIRGPLNEGGLYVERQGYHQPNPPSTSWARKSPLSVLKTGVHFFTTTFTLDLPTNLDVPLAFHLPNSTTAGAFRALLYMNGYQFGKYASTMGPQTTFPVPQGILNHHSASSSSSSSSSSSLSSSSGSSGKNTLALSIWVQSPTAQLADLELIAEGVVETSMAPVVAMPQPGWKVRKGAY